VHINLLIKLVVKKSKKIEQFINVIHNLAGRKVVITCLVNSFVFQLFLVTKQVFLV